MPVKTTFRVEGAKEIEAVLRELGPVAAGRVARSALTKSGTVVVKRAKELVPVDTGELKKAITKRLRRQRRGSDKQELVVGIERPTSRRAHFTEFGTQFAPAQPFLRPSLDENHEAVLRTMGDGMNTGIDREVAKLRAKHRA